MNPFLVRVVTFDSRTAVDFRFISGVDFFMKMREVREIIPDEFLNSACVDIDGGTDADKDPHFIEAYYFRSSTTEETGRWLIR